MCGVSVVTWPWKVRRHTGQFEHVHWPLGHVQLPVLVHPQSGIVNGGGGGGGGRGLVVLTGWFGEPVLEPVFEADELWA